MHTHVFNQNSNPAQVHVDKKGFLTYSSGDTAYYTMPDIPPPTNGDSWAEFERAFMKNINKENLKKQWDFSWDTALIGEVTKPSDLPPFDIVIVMVNEYGNLGKIVIYGVDLIHDSQTLSVEDIYTEVQYQYVARDIEYFHANDFNEAQRWQSNREPPATVTPKTTQEAVDVATGVAPSTLVTPGAETTATGTPAPMATAATVTDGAATTVQENLSALKTGSADTTIDQQAWQEKNTVRLAQQALKAEASKQNYNQYSSMSQEERDAANAKALRDADALLEANRKAKTLARRLRQKPLY
jgi:hypothetical protein